jgi:hypothetical protein
MSCKNVCRLCDHLVISEAVTFATGTLTINLPAGSYRDGCVYCIVLGQTIPATTTITAPVVITIGDGTETYELVDRCCARVTACALNTRTKYKTVVSTDATGGVFKMLGNPCRCHNNNLAAIDGTATAAEGGA